MKLPSYSPVFLVAAFAASNVAAEVAPLTLRQEEATNTISVFRKNASEPILTQNVRPDFRPFLHPIVAPDGRGRKLRSVERRLLELASDGSTRSGSKTVRA